MRTTGWHGGTGTWLAPDDVPERRCRKLESRLRKCTIGGVTGRVSFKHTEDRRKVRVRMGVRTGTIPHRGLTPTPPPWSNGMDAMKHPAT